MSKSQELKKLLEEKYRQYATTDFIPFDPISIPHRFTKKQDIEIAALFASILSWGKREIIIRNASHLMNLMDDCPHNFILNAKNADFKRFSKFKHRTFQPDDAVFILKALQKHYRKHESIENLFIHPNEKTFPGSGISQFRATILGQNNQYRTKKHFPDPLNKSASKRMCMFLRWMVRKNKEGIDFGIWKNLKAENLYLPLDVHTARSARKLGLLKRTIDDWDAVIEITSNLRKMDEKDPIKYDFALFGMSLNNELS